MDLDKKLKEILVKHLNDEENKYNSTYWNEEGVIDGQNALTEVLAAMEEAFYFAGSADLITECQRRERLLNKFGNWLLMHQYVDLKKINSSNRIAEVVTRFLEE